jgi:hypothetical protein
MLLDEWPMGKRFSAGLSVPEVLMAEKLLSARTRESVKRFLGETVCMSYESLRVLCMALRSQGDFW